MRLSSIAALLCCFSPVAFAGTSFDYTLQLRSNLEDGYRLPPLSSFDSSGPLLNSQGEVAVTINSIGGSEQGGIWTSTDQRIVYRTSEDSYISGLALSEAGNLVFDLRHEDFYSLGLHVYRQAQGRVERVLAVDGATPGAPWFFRAPQWLGASSWAFALFSLDQGVAFEVFEQGESRRRSYVEDNRRRAGSPFSYLFHPAFNAQGAIAAKVRLGTQPEQIADSQPDQILYWPALGGLPQAVASDVDHDPHSEFAIFDNSVALGADGSVLFIATMKDGTRGVFRSQGGVLSVVAKTGEHGVSEISYFPPVQNNQGQVAFRGRDERRLETIFVTDSRGALLKAVSEHDLLPTDLGVARVDQNRPQDSVFCGGIALNDRGELAFCSALTPSENDQVEWGSGVFLARPKVSSRE